MAAIKHWADARWNALPGRQAAIKTQYRDQIGANIDGMNNASKKAYLMNVLNGIEESDPIVPDYKDAAGAIVPAGRAIALTGGKRRRTHGRKSHRKSRKSHRRNRKSHRK